MSTMAAPPLSASEKPTTYWFTACQFVVRTEDEGFTREAASLAHAKQMGTTVTACGAYATSWHRLWEVPFTSRVKNPCPRCLEVLAETGPVEPTGRRPRGGADRP
ncbi:MAG: hypothetical protein JWN97_3436 [Nocardioides sp.]|nr:hypothetical protein [Nocardioides sp.]